MPNGLVLDVATCPGAGRAISIARQFGAVGWEAYVFDPFLAGDNGGWTPAECAAIMSAGLDILPLYVPTSSPPAVGHAISVMRDYGWSSGGILLDIEAGDDPGPRWCADWARAVRAAGYSPGLYGLASTLANRGGSWDFRVVASYVFSRIPSPPPDPHSQGADGWQFMGNTDPGVGFEIDANSMDLSQVVMAGQGAFPYVVEG